MIIRLNHLTFIHAQFRINFLLQAASRRAVQSDSNVPQDLSFESLQVDALKAAATLREARFKASQVQS